MPAARQGRRGRGRRTQEPEPVQRRRMTSLLPAGPSAAAMPEQEAGEDAVLMSPYRPGSVAIGATATSAAGQMASSAAIGSGAGAAASCPGPSGAASQPPLPTPAPPPVAALANRPVRRKGAIARLLGESSSDDELGS